MLANRPPAAILPPMEAAESASASIAQHAQALLDRGKQAEARALVEARAASGDADALHLLGEWRLYGLYLPQDFAGAQEALARAAALGHLDAARSRAYLTAAGLGCEPDFDAAEAMLKQIADRDPYAALQLKFLPHMAPEEKAAEAERQVLWEEPRIELIKGLFLPHECAYLVRLGEPQLRPGLILNERGEPVADTVRTSHVMSVLAAQEDLVVSRINRRLALATGTEPSWGEPLNILRYVPGQEYKPHHDAYPGEVAWQRVMTALVYLNRDYEGGETQFPYLGVTGRGDVGDVLVFRNVLKDGLRDERAYHAGLPVRSGVKWLASRWIGRLPYVPE